MRRIVRRVGGAVTERVLASLYDGVTAAEIDDALILGARALIETDPSYTFVAARVLADRIRSARPTRGTSNALAASPTSL